MSDDKRLSIVDALRVARDQIVDQRADANNTMIDCDRTLRMIDGALQRHEEESCHTESGASQHANSADTRSPSTSTHPKAHATSAASSVDASRAVESRTAIGATAHPSAPPSEPEAVRRARELALSNCGGATVKTKLDQLREAFAEIDRLRAEQFSASMSDDFQISLDIERQWIAIGAMFGKDLLAIAEAAVEWRQNLVDIARGVGRELNLTCDQARRLEREAAKWTKEAT